MTTISDDDVRHLATLSSLELADDELSSLRADLENILAYVDALGRVDTSGVEPTYQVTDLENVMRDDVVQESDITRGDLLGLAPASRDNQIEVPKVL